MCTARQCVLHTLGQSAYRGVKEWGKRSALLRLNAYTEDATAKQRGVTSHSSSSLLLLHPKQQLSDSQAMKDFVRLNLLASSDVRRSSASLQAPPGIVQMAHLLRWATPMRRVFAEPYQALVEQWFQETGANQQAPFFWR